MADCCCLEIQYINNLGEGFIAPLIAQETHYNGRCVYLFEHESGAIFYWWYSTAEDLWCLSQTIGDINNNLATWKVDIDCPETEGDPEAVSVSVNE